MRATMSERPAPGETDDPRWVHCADEHCTLGTGDDADTCVYCGVYHGEPCPACGGRGFHRNECSEIG